MAAFHPSCASAATAFPFEGHRLPLPAAARAAGQPRQCTRVPAACQRPTVAAMVCCFPFIRHASARIARANLQAVPCGAAPPRGSSAAACRGTAALMAGGAMPDRQASGCPQTPVGDCNSAPAHQGGGAGAVERRGRSARGGCRAVGLPAPPFEKLRAPGAVRPVCASPTPRWAAGGACAACHAGRPASAQRAGLGRRRRPGLPSFVRGLWAPCSKPCSSLFLPSFLWTFWGCCRPGTWPRRSAAAPPSPPWAPTPGSGPASTAGPPGRPLRPPRGPSGAACTSCCSCGRSRRGASPPWPRCAGRSRA